jgi:signal transduction histidine kinase
MFRKRPEFDVGIFWLLIASVILTIFSELAFTFYIHAYGLSNLLGHFLKIVSFYLIYKAIIVTGLTKPYAMLFRNLKQKEEALHKSRGELEIRVKERTAELAETNVFLKNEIAERKRTEQALRLDEARLEALVKLSQYTDASLKEIADFVLEEGVALTGSEIGFIGFMDEAETDMTIHAWSRSAMSQCSIIDKPIHFAIEKAGLWGDAVKKREPIIINDYSLPNSQKKGYPNGHVKLSRFLGVPVFDRDKIVALVGMANKKEEYDESDIRQLMLLLDGMWRMIQHKIVQEQLQQSKAMLQTVFDGILDPIILLGKNMQVKIINKAAVEYYGVPFSQEIIGKPCYEVFKKRSEPCNGCEVPMAILEGQNTAFEREGLINPDRSEMVFIYLLKREDGVAEDVILRVSDITERKQFEKQIIQSEKMASLGVLVSSIAHEINNPNNFISFNLPILKDYMEEIMPIVDRYAEKTQDFELFEMTYPEFRKDVFSLLNNIEHGSQRITTFVSNLKELSRSNKNRDMKWIDLKTVVESAITICRAKIRKMVKSLTVTVSDNLPQIHTDPNAIEHILINLLVNAAQAADKEDSWIKVNAKMDGTGREHIIIEVRDNGCGIQKKDQKHIYDPFFTTKSVGEGTGLGLYVCHTLAEEIFGQIEFESEPGQGSSFKVILRDAGHGLERKS